MPDNKEKLFFFKGSKNRNLLGFLHLPTADVGKPGILYCHPFADEMNLSYRVAVDTAKRLATHGFPVLRFHLSGCGDSEGELNEVTIDDWNADIESAIECLQTMSHTSQYGLWGLRHGADLALLNEKKSQAASFLVLWQPVISFSAHIQQFLRRKAILRRVENGSNPDKASLRDIIKSLQEDQVVNAMGYPISDRLYQSFLTGNDTLSNFTPACNTLLLSISMMERPNHAIQRYYDALKHAKAKIKLKHINTVTFWDNYWQWESKVVTEYTNQWLQHLYDGKGKSDGN